MDERYTKLAHLLVNHSLRLQEGETVQIDAMQIPDAFTIALIREVRAVGGVPFVTTPHDRIARELRREANDQQRAIEAKLALHRIKLMDGYVGIRGADNIFELSDVPSEQTNAAMKALKPAHQHRVDKTKWVVLRWPTASMAQQAQTSTEAFEDFYFDVCTVDYAQMGKAMQPLVKAMEKAKQVRIIGPGTDLTFSIEGIGVIPCYGERNIPDGECFTAPVKTSVNGTLTYNTPSVYRGMAFDNIHFEFEKGKIVKADCQGTGADQINAILDSDPGARYIGEFSLGFNPRILEPMRDTLFDEKIAGSFHFTPGQAYKNEANNGNNSQVHWDIVCIQRPEYGGGEIYFDGKLIRKDGLFVPKDLQKLNPGQF